MTLSVAVGVSPKSSAKIVLSHIQSDTLEMIAGERLPVQADGEIVGQLPATIAVAARPIPLIRP